jgi:hypothetical protein
MAFRHLPSGGVSASCQNAPDEKKVAESSQRNASGLHPRFTKEMKLKPRISQNVL